MSNAHAYNEILRVLEQHNDVLVDDHGIDIRHNLRDRIKLEEISDRFGIEIEGRWHMPRYIKLSDHQFITLMGEDHKRTLSWSDDGRQPDNEWLYVISFPTGAYIFGGDYPKETFNKFFNELVEYDPKYKDTNNNNLYFAADNARFVHNAFHEIFQKYRVLVQDELRQKRIKELETLLAKEKGNE